MKKLLYVSLLIMIFVLLIQWVVDFQFLTLKDLKLMITLSLGTMILLLLPKDQQHVKSRFRFYLFFTALIMSIFMMYHGLPSNLENLELTFTESLKPFLFAILLYFPGDSMVQLYLVHHPQTQPWQNDLSRREKEVYDLILLDKTNKEMSEALYIAESTVKKHVQNILKKANATNKDDLKLTL